MKWYQLIECNDTVKNPLVCDSDNLEINGFNEYDFLAGKIVDNWSENIFFQATEKEDDGDPDDALQNHLMLPIFSERLIGALRKENIEGIQYLPVKILRPNGEELKGFAIANLINFIDAFDYEKSNYDVIPSDFPNPNARGEIAGVRKFSLLKEKLHGFDVIRLKNYELRFFVSETIKNIFKKNKFTGYSFKEVELT